MADRPRTENQLSADLPGPVTFLTGHNAQGKAVIHSSRPAKWEKYDGDRLAMAEAFMTEFPADLNDDADVALFEARQAGAGAKGLVVAKGTMLRYVDFAPGYECMMHRTQSLDYGIVLEGNILSVLDSGETVLMARGDVMVQRATMHAWRNPSDTEWARMIFCLQDCKSLFVGGKHMGEEHAQETEGIPKSGNDAAGSG